MSDYELTCAGNSMAVANTWTQLQRALDDVGAVDVHGQYGPLKLNEWSMDLDALRLLASLVRHVRPQQLVEFGSGQSTKVLARSAVDERLACSIVSLDHDPEYGQFGVQVPLGKDSVSVTSIAAHLVARDFGGELVPCYYCSPSLLPENVQADIVVVDGPPVALGGRKGTLFQAMGWTRAGTLVLLDDAKRSHERSVLNEWQRVYGDAIEVRMLPGFARGLAAIVVHKPVPANSLVEHCREVLAQELRETIPEHSRVVLIDESYFQGVHDYPYDLRRLGPTKGNCGWLPPDDDAVIGELESLVKDDVQYVVIAWPSYWWFDYYTRFVPYLESRYHVLCRNSRIAVYQVATPC